MLLILEQTSAKICKLISNWIFFECAFSGTPFGVRKLSLLDLRSRAASKITVLFRKPAWVVLSTKDPKLMRKNMYAKAKVIINICSRCTVHYYSLQLFDAKQKKSDHWFRQRLHAQSSFAARVLNVFHLMAVFHYPNVNHFRHPLLWNKK